MNPYQEFVAAMAGALRRGEELPLGQASPPVHSPLPEHAPKVLLFSPHPDDEVVTGGLPLRLLREAKMNVLNVAVTLGSRKDRQVQRLQELKRCCQHVGFGLVQAAERGLDSINLKTRQNQPQLWARAVHRIAEILQEHKPHAIFFPHERDWNSTHIGTHYLVADALGQLGDTLSPWVVETEFWGAMDDPNLMVETSVSDLVDLITGLTFHVGEVTRNPYHLRLPGWMMDNVRRGGELVGGQGGAAPDFAFATLYRVRRWQAGAFRPVFRGGRSFSQHDTLGDLWGG